MTEKPATFKEVLKDYCANCSLAGIHFIADETKHWLERLLWLILVTLSWYGSAVLIIAAWEASCHPISFGVETTYLTWDTKMPAVAICELMNDEQIYNVSDFIWSPDHTFDLEDVLRDIAYFRGIAYTLVEICYETDEPDPYCPMSNYSYLAKLVRSNCPKMIKNCFYNDQEFDCCNFFHPIETDMGPCFIINSKQTRKPNTYPMITNMQQKRGVIKFEVYSKAMMYTLGEDEVPSITTVQSSTLRLQLGHSYRRLVTVRNIENDVHIVDTTTEQRACRFSYENEDGLYPFYSYSACTVGVRKKGQMGMCGCNDHFMLGTTESDHCNLTGMACLHKNYKYLTALKPIWASHAGLACSCLPSCNETEITVIGDSVTSHREKLKKKADVEVVLAYLATERFKRNVVRSRLDLVVSVGGTTSLLVGASILSFVELIFYFTVRFTNNIILMSKRTRENEMTTRPTLEEQTENKIKCRNFNSSEPFLDYLP